MLLKLLPQMLVDGLQLGFVYAIVALGYTMVYGVLHFINFANAEIFMCGAFIGAEVLIALLGAAAGGGWTVFAFAVALLAALVLTGLLGVFIERVAYRPLRSAPRLVHTGRCPALYLAAHRLSPHPPARGGIAAAPLPPHHEIPFHHAAWP